MAKITFRRVSVENLGPFRERQELDLDVRRSKPVILIKALNGSGKTTLLTCLQVVLYGTKVFGGRSGEYEQLIRGLHRADATGKARIALALTVESGGEREDLTVIREWTITASRLSERLEVLREEVPDLHLAEEWPNFIDAILPSELLQLFLFDGEKIEALANPRSLPEMLRRATEAFLGIGGIDALSKDLVAVERRALLHARDVDGDYARARDELEHLQGESSRVEEVLQVHAQRRAEAQLKLDKVREEHEEYRLHAARQGLSAYEQAAEMRAAEAIARERTRSAEEDVRASLADPYLPLARLDALWGRYKEQWQLEEEALTSKLILAEMKKRDSRLIKATQDALGVKACAFLKSALQQENSRYVKASKVERQLVQTTPPSEVERYIGSAVERHRLATSHLAGARTRLDEIERKLAAVPSKEQVAEVLEQLRLKSDAVTRAEAELDIIDRQLEEERGRAAHLRLRSDAAAARMRDDFKGKELDSRAIEASQRTRAILSTFKDRLLASKATWLSEMITGEFSALLRKQKLIDRVEVAPDSYTITIIARSGEVLPMERLSAGERQLLAIAVLSALIRERKGHFPVVVDTPLARLDRTHRQTLIQRFFAKISHQVLVLSTDEEVEGVVLEAMQRHTSAAYLIQFADEERRSHVDPLYLEAA